MIRLTSVGMLAPLLCVSCAAMAPPPDPSGYSVAESEYLGNLSLVREPWATAFRFNGALSNQMSAAIRTEPEWRSLWGRISAGSSFRELPAIDFNREMLLVAAMGQQRSGGYATTIETVVYAPAEIVATITRTSPSPTCGAAAAITEPLDMVRVPLSAKPVRWVVRNVSSDCS